MTQLPDPQSQPEFYRDVPMKRLFAWVIDSLIVVIMCIIIVPFTAFTGLFFFPFLILIVGFVYRVITLANGSATWGMRLTAIELRRVNGERFDAGAAFAHTLGYSISWAIAPLQLVSIVMMATTYRGQGLSDHALGTVALNRKALL
ncbi:MAG: RDD family protein [Sulfitobacter sp.]